MTTFYTNPVINIDFADPSIIKTPYGYFAYGTRSYEAGKEIHIQTAHSLDLVHWTMLDDALPAKPSWAHNTIDFWAPHVIEDNGTYYMYYSTDPDNKRGMGIGVAIADKPEGPFIDSGKPLITGSTFTTIDPMAFDDPLSHKEYLIWGSGHGPIWIRELADNRSEFKNDSVSEKILETSTYPYENLIEGAFMIYKDPYYYLFYSGDNVWKKGRYVVMVARSKAVTGPYEKKADVLEEKDSVILHSNKMWDAPGQNSVITDDMGDLWMVYHAVDIKHRLNAGTDNLRRVVLMDKIEFIGGWPYIKNRSPSFTQQPAPYVRAPSQISL